ncbi:hypothetical protein JT086_03175 [Helicobacter pylori]|nr:hypothetical protein [Helicobacter pylori]
MSVFDEDRVFLTLEVKTQTGFLKFFKMQSQTLTMNKKSPNYKRLRDFKNEAKNEG